MTLPIMMRNLMMVVSIIIEFEMVTLEEIKNSENEIAFLEHKLEDAKILNNSLRTRYVTENAKFKNGDICRWKGSDNGETYTIQYPILFSDNTIRYAVIRSHPSLFASFYVCEENLVLINENL